MRLILIYVPRRVKAESTYRHCMQSVFSPCTKLRITASSFREKHRNFLSAVRFDPATSCAAGKRATTRLLRSANFVRIQDDASACKAKASKAKLKKRRKPKLLCLLNCNNIIMQLKWRHQNDQLHLLQTAPPRVQILCNYHDRCSSK